jgi:hypothetical protein
MVIWPKELLGSTTAAPASPMSSSVLPPPGSTRPASSGTVFLTSAASLRSAPVFNSKREKRRGVPEEKDGRMSRSELNVKGDGQISRVCFGGREERRGGEGRFLRGLSGSSWRERFLRGAKVVEPTVLGPLFGDAEGALLEPKHL